MYVSQIVNSGKPGFKIAFAREISVCVCVCVCVCACEHVCPPPKLLNSREMKSEYAIK